MAYVNATRTHSPSVMDRFAALTQNFRAAMARRRIYTETVSELRALSDRELSDLGIARATIHDIAQEAAYGK